MFKWLFRKQIARAEALEKYLDQFSPQELGYIHNLFVTSLLTQAEPAERVQSVKILSYIHGALLVKSSGYKSITAVHQDKDALYKLGTARANWQAALSKVVASFKGKSTSEIFSLLYDMRVNEEEIDDSDKNRLGYHSTMIQRIFHHGKDAPYLPELDKFNQGRAWGPFWKK